MMKKLLLLIIMVASGSGLLFAQKGNSKIDKQVQINKVVDLLSSGNFDILQNPSAEFTEQNLLLALRRKPSMVTIDTIGRGKKIYNFVYNIPALENDDSLGRYYTYAIGFGIKAGSFNCINLRVYPSGVVRCKMMPVPTAHYLTYQLNQIVEPVYQP